MTVLAALTRRLARAVLARRPRPQPVTDLTGPATCYPHRAGAYGPHPRGETAP